MSAAAHDARWRDLVVPAVATLIAFAVLVSLGTWQLQRKAWKDGIIARIEARAHGEPGALAPEASWPQWRAEDDEFRRVAMTGRFLADKEAPVHGLMSGQRGAPLQGYYLFTPLERPDGSIVIVNRGFVPTELRDPARRPDGPASGGPAPGEVTVTGLVRAPERRTWFVPENDPSRNEWFVRDVAEIARARGLERVAPFIVDADAAPNPGGWPKGGQTLLALPNAHLQYALTWFGLALTLVGVAGAWAWGRIKGRRLVPPPLPS